MFERPEIGDRALVVALDIGRVDGSDRLAEIAALAESAGATVVGNLRGRRPRPDAALFAGRGKVDEIAAQRRDADADLVIFDHTLSGVQQRNLEQALECRVVDRTSLILDIFAQRARSAEGKLQVELAQLNHMATRLVGGWTHLERQKGGIGLRGPGEILGTRQSGEEAFRAATPEDVASLAPIAQSDAQLLLDRDGGLSGPRGQAARVCLYLFERDQAVDLIRSG